MEDTGTSRAAGAHSPDLPAVIQPTLAPAAIPEEPQGFRRYQTRMGLRAPSPVPQRRCRRARPSKQARTSSPGESSRSRPEPSPPPTDEGSSPQLSPASRIRGPMFTSNPIPGNVDLLAKDFHGEPFFPSIHDAAAFLLSPGCARVLPYYDIPGSAEPVGAPVQHRRPPGSTPNRGHYSCLGPASRAGKFFKIQRLAPAIPERDGPLSRSRYYSGTRTLPQAASTTDAPSGLPTPDQIIPTIALCSVEGSYT